jgi:hypothetical protein
VADRSVAKPKQRGELPRATPLLWRGDKRYATSLVEGQLTQGLEGTSAVYAYEFSEDSGSDVYRWNVVLTAVPEVTGFAPSISCHARGVRFAALDDRAMGILDYALGEVGDTSRMPEREVRLESEAVRSRFTLRVDRDIGENWVRQLFSPQFIAWLEAAPEKLCFELFDGNLCVFMPQAAGTIEEVVDAAAHVAARMREEALEEAGMATAARAAQTDRPERSLDAATARAVATVRWTRPPADEKEAIRAYWWVGMRTWKPWVYAPVILVAGLLVGTLVVVAEVESSSPDEGLLGGLAMVFMSPVVAWWTFRKFVGDRARRFGRAAFAAEYAESRALTPENPRLVQARNMSLRFPGVAESAMTGVLPGTDLQATLVFSGQGSGSQRRDHNVVITALPEGLEVPEDGGLGRELTCAVGGRAIAVWTQVTADAGRSATELDDFVIRVAKAL